MNFEFEKVVMQILYFLLVFRKSKNVIKTLAYYIVCYLLYIIFFLWKKIIFSVFSPYFQ
jgi:hypothetical protein